MWVAPAWPGDDIPLAWQQHDVYERALAAMLRAGRRVFLQACYVADVSGDAWPEDVRIDHRTLQQAHDLLAAVWRWQISPPQPDLLASPTAEAVSIENWLAWLEHEVTEWRGEPEMVRSLLEIVRHQNEAVGYANEDRLARAICRRFNHLPWPELDDDG